jgi:hypothetical protein
MSDSHCRGKYVWIKSYWWQEEEAALSTDTCIYFADSIKPCHIFHMCLGFRFRMSKSMIALLLSLSDFLARFDNQSHGSRSGRRRSPKSPDIRRWMPLFEGDLS